MDVDRLVEQAVERLNSGDVAGAKSLLGEVSKKLSLLSGILGIISVYSRPKISDATFCNGSAFGSSGCLLVSYDVLSSL